MIRIPQQKKKFKAYDFFSISESTIRTDIGVGTDEPASALTVQYHKNF